MVRFGLLFVVLLRSLRVDRLHCAPIKPLSAGSSPGVGVAGHNWFHLRKSFLAFLILLIDLRILLADDLQRF